jgi:hypothetical protein
MEDGDRLKGEQVKHERRLLGTEQSADPIEKHEQGLGEENAGDGKQLLLVRRDAGSEIIIAV